MPLFNVPQYIDVEDKIAGPFTGKQLLWMFGLGAVLLILWNMLEKAMFFIVGIPTAILFGALAFYRPYNQPLIRFIFSAFGFVFKPKLYVWKRTIPTVVQKKPTEEKKKKENVIQQDKKITADELADLARTLDTQGVERSQRIMELIKKNQKNK